MGAIVNPRTGLRVEVTYEMGVLARRASLHHAALIWHPSSVGNGRSMIGALTALSAACGGLGSREAALSVAREIAHFCTRDCVGGLDCRRAIREDLAARKSAYRAAGGRGCYSCWANGDAVCSASCKSRRA